VSAPLGVPAASAEPCPDVEVVFARGTGEPAGVGGVGQAFVDALRSQVGNRSVGVYAVNHPASGDFADGVAFAGTVVDGIRDEGNHVQSVATTCPQHPHGARRIFPVRGLHHCRSRAPRCARDRRSCADAPEVANHVAAVALFGKPSAQFLQSYAAPAIVIGPLYQPKTIDLCAQGDAICDGGPTFAHALHPVNGMVAAAATFVASRL
jgi:cutinase